MSRPERAVFGRASSMSSTGVLAACAVTVTGAATLAPAPCARADMVAYLVNVHVRPGTDLAAAEFGDTLPAAGDGRMMEGKPRCGIGR